MPKLTGEKQNYRSASLGMCKRHPVIVEMFVNLLFFVISPSWKRRKARKKKRRKGKRKTGEENNVSDQCCFFYLQKFTRNTFIIVI